MTEQQREITIHFEDREAADRLLEELPRFGVTLARPDDVGEDELTLLAAAVLVGTVGGLVHVVIEFWKKVRGGTVIDLTGEKPDIRSDADVPRGWLIIIAKDGKVELKKEDLPPDALERLVTDLLDHGKSLSTAAIELLKKSAESGGETQPSEA
jgi:hypothetical protein